MFCIVWLLKVYTMKSWIRFLVRCHGSVKMSTNWSLQKTGLFPPENQFMIIFFMIPGLRKNLLKPEFNEGN